MANPVFKRALDGLATMVSARAARRVLEAGVRSVAETPDTIPAKTMQALLVGYVHREFEQMLPREGLKRNLEQLAKRVGELSIAPPQPKLPNPYDSSEVDAVTAALSYFTRVNIEATPTSGEATNNMIDASKNDAIANGAVNGSVNDASIDISNTPQTSTAEQVMLTGQANSGQAKADGSTTNRARVMPTAFSSQEDTPSSQATSSPKRRPQAQSSTQQATRHSPPSPSPSTPTSSTPVSSTPAAAMWQDQFDVSAKTDKLKDITREGTIHEGTIMADSIETKSTLSEAQLETIVMKFAQVEHARLVAAVRENGTIVTSRGAGVDLNSLSRFGLMGLRLLERSGHLRSYYLSHTQGQLFLFCFGRDTVIMLGSSDINVGTVFATLASLKDNA
ncbi:MAG: hypothetical protein AAF267_07870 [Deinococcota bacterium]